MEFWQKTVALILAAMTTACSAGSLAPPLSSPVPPAQSALALPEDQIDSTTYWLPAMVRLAAMSLATRMSGKCVAGISGKPSQPWSRPITAVPYVTPLFLEENAIYHIFVQDAAPNGRPVEFAISGTLPDALYASFHVYDAKNGLPLAAVPDLHFAPGGGRYSLTIRQSGSASLSGFDHAANTLFVASGPQQYAIIYRLYVAGEVSGDLPAVEIRDQQTSMPLDACGSRASLPEFVSNGEQAGAMREVIEAMRGFQRERINAGDAWPIRFFSQHPETSPFMASVDIIYTFAVLEPALGDYAYVRFRPPPDVGRGSPVVFWSACLNGIRGTATAGCIGSHEAKIGPDGYVRILIGPPHARMQDEAAAPAINRFGWGRFAGPQALILRQLYAPGGRGTPGTFARVPDITSAGTSDIASQRADRYIGEASPVGRYCSRESVANGSCLAQMPIGPISSRPGG